MVATPLVSSIDFLLYWDNALELVRCLLVDSIALLDETTWGLLKNLYQIMCMHRGQNTDLREKTNVGWRGIFFNNEIRLSRALDMPSIVPNLSYAMI